MNKGENILYSLNSFFWPVKDHCISIHKSVGTHSLLFYFIPAKSVHHHCFFEIRGPHSFLTVEKNTEKSVRGLQSTNHSSATDLQKTHENYRREDFSFVSTSHQIVILSRQQN